MTHITCCMIVRDEEKHIAACIESVAPAVDDFVIFDTGSRDSTRDVLQEIRRTSRVPMLLKAAPFIGFSDARERALSATRHTYTTHVLVMDADQRLLNPEEVRRTIEANPDVPSWACLESHANDPVTMTWIQRLFRLDPDVRYARRPVHEYIVNDRGRVPFEPSSIRIHNLGYTDASVVKQKLLRNRRMLTEWLAAGNWEDEEAVEKLCDTLICLRRMAHSATHQTAMRWASQPWDASSTKSKGEGT